MGNRNMKYMMHNESCTDGLPLPKDAHDDDKVDSKMSCDNSGDTASPNVSVDSSKDPRSPTVEFTRTSFYSKLTTHNDRAYSQLATVMDDGHNTWEASAVNHPPDALTIMKSDDNHSQELPDVLPGSAALSYGVQHTPSVEQKEDACSTLGPVASLPEAVASAIRNGLTVDDQVAEQLEENATTSGCLSSAEVPPSSSSASATRRSVFPRIAFGVAKYSPIHSSDD